MILQQAPVCVTVPWLKISPTTAARGPPCSRFPLLTPVASAAAAAAATSFILDEKCAQQQYTQDYKLALTKLCELRVQVLRHWLTVEQVSRSVLFYGFRGEPDRGHTTTNTRERHLKYVQGSQ